jgi:hypothetical protein
VRGRTRDGNVEAVDELPRHVGKLELCLLAKLQDFCCSEALRVRGDAKAVAVTGDIVRRRGGANRFMIFNRPNIGGQQIDGSSPVSDYFHVTENMLSDMLRSRIDRHRYNADRVQEGKKLFSDLFSMFAGALASAFRRPHVLGSGELRARRRSSGTRIVSGESSGRACQMRGQSGGSYRRIRKNRIPAAAMNHQSHAQLPFVIVGRRANKVGSTTEIPGALRSSISSSSWLPILRIWASLHV